MVKNSVFLYRNDFWYNEYITRYNQQYSMLHVTFTHPETRKNETFLMNLSDDKFQSLTLPSKRKGTQLFDGLGNKIKWENKFPVFISSDNNVSELRKTLQN